MNDKEGHSLHIGDGVGRQRVLLLKAYFCISELYHAGSMDVKGYLLEKKQGL